MTRGTKRILAACAAAVTALAGLQVAGSDAAHAGCDRVIFINPEMTVHEDANRVVFTVFSSVSCTAAGSVDYGITPGSALPGVDYVPVSGTLHWAAGDVATRRIVVPVGNDAVPEAELKDFTLRLSLPTVDIKVGNSAGRGRILDDDNAIANAVLDDQICPPIDLGMTSPPGQPWLQGEQRIMCDLEDGVIIGVDCELSHSNTIRYGTVNSGTAEPGVDYVAVFNAQVVVPAGAALFRLPIGLVERPASTPGRWFYVEIRDSSGCTFGDPSAVLAIPGPLKPG